jgi:GDP-D-mannose dehydratase
MNVLVTGSEGFIGGYVVQELVNKGHVVIGIDNLSKYGGVTRTFDNSSVMGVRFRVVRGLRTIERGLRGLRELRLLQSAVVSSMFGLSYVSIIVAFLSLLILHTTVPFVFLVLRSIILTSTIYFK